MKDNGKVALGNLKSLEATFPINDRYNRGRKKKVAGYAVLKGASYTLAITPDMVLHNGTTQTTEKTVNPDSDYLKELPGHLRSYEDAVAYLPNQVYIGNKSPEDLAAVEFPWYDKKTEGLRQGRYGEIMPQDEFIGMMQICDVFDLVKLEKTFAGKVRKKLAAHSLIGEEKAAILDKNEDSTDEIRHMVETEHAEPLYNEGILVGAVKKAHDIDVNLSSHVMLENIVTKASSVLSLMYLVKNTGIDAAEIEYVIDCCEEACGDMNQRGGGNFAKAAAEAAGLVNATGSDVRGFCAGPAHALLEAASLVKAGTFRTVAVTAGGCTAKLGMNGKDHVKKGMPVLEDAIAGFAVLITADDGVSPQIRNDIVGRHTVGTGASPQAVISSLVTKPLGEAGLKICEVDKYSPEMQNPDITKPAGAGDVPESNYKMIAALGVKQGELERKEIPDFVKNHGMMGWAPTQGHIPSGVPYLGFAREDIMSGKIQRAMIIGKGSLFLGRMTNLFDGVSFIVEANDGKAPADGKIIKEAIAKTFTDIADGPEAGTFGKTPVIAIAADGSEHGGEVLDEAVKLTSKKGIRTVLLRGENAHSEMEEMLKSGRIDGAVTMHYPFPIGVSTVGKIVTPAMGKSMYLATTTGTSDTDRTAAMIKNAIYGIIAAKADGVEEPTVGIANIDGARQCEKALRQLRENGYPIKFAESSRADGGIVMRGNDLLRRSADVIVMDSLTGNLMVKIFSSYTTGGSYESLGWGYGPGVGEDFEHIIMIISRASGAPLIAGAAEYAAELIKNDLTRIAKSELAMARKAGLDEILAEICDAGRSDSSEKKSIEPPQKEVVTAQIAGIEVMDLEDAVSCLWEEKIYAESGMGCTGPIVMISEANKEKALKILEKKKFV